MVINHLLTGMILQVGSSCGYVICQFLIGWLVFVGKPEAQNPRKRADSKKTLMLFLGHQKKEENPKLFPLSTETETENTHTQTRYYLPKL